MFKKGETPEILLRAPALLDENTEGVCKPRGELSPETTAVGALVAGFQLPEPRVMDVCC